MRGNVYRDMVLFKLQSKVNLEMIGDSSWNDVLKKRLRISNTSHLSNKKIFILETICLLSISMT
ncbi:hypothetical protein N9Q76_01385 [Flavobacteriales bacterium]|nr:hypothetical protein [Flavobacteriales bacterium]